MLSRIGLCAYVCMYMYVHQRKYVSQQKNRLFSALALRNLLLSVLYSTSFLLSLNASSVFAMLGDMYTQLMLFQMRRESPLLQNKL